MSGVKGVKGVFMVWCNSDNWHQVFLIAGIWLSFFFISNPLNAQEKSVEICRIMDGKLVFTLDPQWSAAERAKIAKQYNLDSTLVAEAFKGLPEVVVNSVKWNIRQVGKGLIELSKASVGLADLGKLLEPVFMVNDPWLRSGAVDSDDLAVYGINRFSKPEAFDYRDSVVTLLLPGYGYAKSVYIAGSFNNWSVNETPVSKTENGWTIKVKLGPGHYPYKYIVDGRWTQDPNNKNREDDLRGATIRFFIVTTTPSISRVIRRQEELSLPVVSMDLILMSCK